MKGYEKRGPTLIKTAPTRQTSFRFNNVWHFFWFWAVFGGLGFVLLLGGVCGVGVHLGWGILKEFTF